MLKDFREEREEAEPAKVTAQHSAAQRSMKHVEGCSMKPVAVVRAHSCTVVEDGTPKDG